MTHIMIDLETLGLDPVKAPIIQIGAAAFELDGDGPSAPLFCSAVNVPSNLTEPFNRCINAETVAWWAETDAPLLVKLMRGVGPSLTTVLSDLSVWVRRVNHDVQGVWSNGPTFDIAMLEHAYNQEGMVVPWSFRAIRDVRTMAMIAGDDKACWEGGTKTEIEEKGEKHDALVDCLRQLRMVQQTYQRRVRKLQEMAFH